MAGKMKGQEERTTGQPSEDTTPVRPPVNELLRFGFPFFSFSLSLSFLFVSLRFGHDFAFFVVVTCSPRKGKATIQMLL